VVRVDLDRLLVLSLAAALQVRVAQVEAVLVDLDVRADVVRTVTASAREVRRRRVLVGRAVVVPALRQLEGREARQQTLLHVGHLVVEPQRPRLRLRDARRGASAEQAEAYAQREQRQEQAESPS